MTTLDMNTGANNQGNDGSPKWIEYLLVGLILLLAGALRMASPGLTEFKADEARQRHHRRRRGSGRLR